ncbi:MAG: Ig-like domain-containing protein, partial [Firmicutes bacterium]|nr:Ig-like domain-containing protein [Bacillota bacterium]
MHFTGNSRCSPPAEDTSTAEVTQPEESVEPLDAVVRTQYNSSGGIDIIVEASGGVAPYTYQWQLAWIVAMTETDATWSDWEDEPGATDPVYTVPVTDGFQCRCIVTDSAGNSASATHTISVDTTAPVISVNTLSGDDVLNAAEAQQPLTVHGSSSAEAGQTVTVTLGGKTYTALVANDGTWTLDVPAADLANLSEGALTVTASVNDKAG